MPEMFRTRFSKEIVAEFLPPSRPRTKRLNRQARLGLRLTRAGLWCWMTQRIWAAVSSEGLDAVNFSGSPVPASRRSRESLMKECMPNFQCHGEHVSKTGPSELSHIAF